MSDPHKSVTGADRGTTDSTASLTRADGAARAFARRARRAGHKVLTVGLEPGGSARSGRLWPVPDESSITEHACYFADTVEAPSPVAPGLRTRNATRSTTDCRGSTHAED